MNAVSKHSTQLACYQVKRSVGKASGTESKCQGLSHNGGAKFVS